MNGPHLESVGLLLSHGADVTLCNHKGLDALAFAHEFKAHHKTMFSEYAMRELDQVIDYLSLYTCANQARNMISSVATRAQAGAQGNAP